MLAGCALTSAVVLWRALREQHRIWQRAALPAAPALSEPGWQAAGMDYVEGLGSGEAGPAKPYRTTPWPMVTPPARPN
jgi:hypothetical protein